MVKKGSKIKYRLVTGKKHKFWNAEKSYLINGLLNSGEIHHRCNPCNRKYNRKNISENKSYQNIQILINTL